jgi:hypothetical protein
MRIRLLVDCTTDDLERLQRYVADQPAVQMQFVDDHGTPVDAPLWGRFVGAKEAHDPTDGGGGGA